MRLSLVRVTGYSQPSFSQRVAELPVGYEARVATYTLPNPAVITVNGGTYAEKLVIPSWKRNIRLVGKGRNGVVITHADFSGMEREHVDFADNVAYGTYTSYTVLVQGDDCVLEDLKVAITAGPVGRADRCAFINFPIGASEWVTLQKKSVRNYFNDCLGDPWIYNEYVDGRKLTANFDNYPAARTCAHRPLRVAGR